MDSKFALALFLFISSSSVLQVFSDDTLGQSLGGLLSQAGAASGGGGGGAASPCMQKLMPCQQYLHSSSPPPECCTPLKEMVTKDSECLCKVFNDPNTLKSLNVTKDEAMALPKACGTSADMSVCKAASPGPATFTLSNDSSSSPSSAKAPSPSEKNNASSSRMVAGGFFLSFLVFIVSLY